MRLVVPECRPLDDADLLDLYDDGADGLLRAGFVQSADGAVVLDGTSRPLQTPADAAVFRALRGVCDAVVVGAGTARRERYGAVRLRPQATAWRLARGRTEAPRLVVVTRTGRLGDEQRAADPLVVTTADAAASLNGLDVVVTGEREVGLPTAVTALRERGLGRLLCEGGPSLLGDLVTARLVDELCLTTSPLLAGRAPSLLPAALPEPVALGLVSLVAADDGTLLARWRVRR